MLANAGDRIASRAYNYLYLALRKDDWLQAILGGYLESNTGYLTEIRPKDTPDLPSNGWGEQKCFIPKSTLQALKMAMHADPNIVETIAERNSNLGQKTVVAIRTALVTFDMPER